MKELLFATGNIAKINRFKDKLKENNINLISLKDIDISLDVTEDGKTAIENALIKARAYSNKLDMPVIAMDDTLYFDNVPEDIQPGLYVRRVKDKVLTDDEMIEYYSNLAKKYGVDGKIVARWIYGMALINNGKEYTYTWSKEDFYITSTPSDIINTGYPLNSISINMKLNKYFTDLTTDDKKELYNDESEVIDFIVKSLEKK